MTVRVLLTGFRKFGGLAENPSEDVVNRIRADPPADVELETLILPVEYGGAFAPVRGVLDAGRVGAVVHVGVAATRSAIEVERFAVNWRGATQADEAGVILGGARIDPRGPAALESTLPIDALVEAIRRTGAPAQPSAHAGTFLCNQVLYQTLRHVRLGKLGVRAAFIHIPLPGAAGGPADICALTAGIVAAVREAAGTTPADRSVRTRRATAR